MSALLLDTNVVIWLLVGDQTSISPRAREALEDERHAVTVSAVSVWEIAIKRSAGKLDIEARWPKALSRLGFDALPISALHAERVEHLAWHHRDPFDRLLVAQAELEDHVLVTADERLGAYEVETLW